MTAAVSYIGRKAGRWYVVPATLRARFRLAGGRIARQATPEQTAAAAQIRGHRIVPLSLVQVAPTPQDGSPPSRRYDLDEVRRRVEAGESVASVARDVGVNRSTLTRALAKAGA